MNFEWSLTLKSPEHTRTDANIELMKGLPGGVHVALASLVMERTVLNSLSDSSLYEGSTEGSAIFLGNQNIAGHWFLKQFISSNVEMRRLSRLKASMEPTLASPFKFVIEFGWNVAYFPEDGQTTQTNTFQIKLNRVYFCCNYKYWLIDSSYCIGYINKYVDALWFIF